MASNPIEIDSTRFLAVCAAIKAKPKASDREIVDWIGAEFGIDVPEQFVAGCRDSVLDLDRNIRRRLDALRHH
jgi:hypothetical protein